MNSRIKRVYESGRKLKFTIARPDGKPKGAPLQPLPESETPNLYTAIPLTTPEPGDMVMVYPADEKVTWEGKPLYWEGHLVVTEGDAIERLCEEHKSENTIALQPITPPAATPKTDSTLIYQSDTATFYNIPKATLSKASKKKPGEIGYLWSGRNGKRVFYRKSDCEKLARSRKALRR